jgi:hypothetical protein
VPFGCLRAPADLAWTRWALPNETVPSAERCGRTRHGPPAMTEGSLKAKEIALPSLSQVHFRLGTKAVTGVRSNEGARGGAPGRSLPGPRSKAYEV